MALKALLLRSRLESAKKKLEALREKDADFKTREEELETSIAEMDDSTTDEDRASVESLVDDFNKEKEAHEKEVKELEDTVAEIEADLQKEEARAKAAAEKKPEEREEGGSTMKRSTNFYGLNAQERDAFFAREDVKGFLGSIRTCISEKRALSNAGLTVPTVMLGMIKQVVETKSKLIKYVNKKHTPGTGRQNVMGTIPEGIWTEMCGKINDLDIIFNNVEVDGYKVGGFVAVCNAIIEDSDENLATEIIEVIGAAIALATDKAIVYGKGTKMPLGIVTRLAQSVEPETNTATDRAWADLRATHILTGTGATGTNLIKEIVKRSAAAESSYSAGDLVWLMNRKTKTTIMAESMDKNLNAALVAGLNNKMPVIGGDIVELPFIPEGDIVFGYMDLYLLTERAGVKIEQSEHVRFLEDQTVFKGTGRYDGKPAIAEAFGLLSITTTAPTTTVAFAADRANEAAG